MIIDKQEDQALFYKNKLLKTLLLFFKKKQFFELLFRMASINFHISFKPPKVTNNDYQHLWNSCFWVGAFHVKSQYMKKKLFSISRRIIEIPMIFLPLGDHSMFLLDSKGQVKYTHLLSLKGR